jgi:hypothetical protein
MSEAQVTEVIEQPKQASSIVTSENLAEYNADKLGLASESSPTAADTVDEKSSSEPAADKGQSEPKLAEDEATGTDEKKQNPKLEKRFSELTKARKEAEARAEELEKRLVAIESKQAPIQAPESNRKPTPDDFKDAFEYAEALADWSAEQALARRDQEVKQKEVQAKRETVIQTWQQKLEATKAELPDYEVMVQSSSMSVNDTVRDAIVESDVGPRILYELASNDELAEKLSAMTTAGALKLIGKLEAQFEKTEAPVAGKKTVAAKSKAPEPIRPLRSTGGVADVGTDGSDMSYQQWKAARQAGKIR